jgi:predicted extracellular nuclease
VHFPSRREGKKKSEPRRINAAKVVRKIVDEILATDANAKIIIMGDCNDEPTDISLTQYIKADNSQTPNDGILFNAMYSLHQAGKGSYFHENKFDMIDNLIVSDGLLFAESGIKYKKNSAAVFQPLFITQQKPEKFKGAPQRTFAGDKYFSNGYSDHFPIYCILEKK